MPIRRQISSEKGEGKKIQADLQRTISACCLLKAPVQGLSPAQPQIKDACDHFTVSAAGGKRMGFTSTDSVFLSAVSISKAQGNSSVIGAIQNLLRGDKNIYL